MSIRLPLRLTWVAAATCTAALSGNAAVTEIAISPSRTSGPAPLAVHFDATATRSDRTERPFHELHYEWDFGDHDAGTWVTGHSRNYDHGPLAGHVFETPGTHTVTLRVTDSGGETRSTTATITVRDPDDLFGENTLCISRSGDFAGAPPNSHLVSTGDLSCIRDSIDRGMRRVLLRRGEEWEFDQALSIDVAGPGMIGAFGAGDKPVIHYTGLGENGYLMVLDPTGIDYASGERYDWRITGLTLIGNARSSSLDGDLRPTAIGSAGSDRSMPAGVLLHEVDAYNFHQAFSVESDDGAIVGCRAVRLIDRPGGGGTWLHGDRFLLLGTIYDGGVEEERAAEHLLRAYRTRGSVFAHNHWYRAGRHALKIHAANYTGLPPTEDMYSENLVIADNRFVGGTGDMAAWTVSIGPQNSAYDERLRNVIVEKNCFVESPLTQVHLHLASTDTVTVRNNIFISLQHSAQAIAVGRRGSETLAAANVRVVNNTAVAESPDAVFCGLDTDVSGAGIHNNAFAKPDGGATRLVDWSGETPDFTAGNNLVAPSPGFTALPPPLELPDADAAVASRAEWEAYLAATVDWESQHQPLMPDAASPLVDAGTALPDVSVDFRGAARPARNGYDIGARELGAATRTARTRSFDTRAGRHAGARIIGHVGAVEPPPLFGATAPGREYGTVRLYTPLGRFVGRTGVVRAARGAYGGPPARGAYLVRRYRNHGR